MLVLMEWFKHPLVHRSAHLEKHIYMMLINDVSEMQKIAKTALRYIIYIQIFVSESAKRDNVYQT